MKLRNVMVCAGICACVALLTECSEPFHSCFETRTCHGGDAGSDAGAVGLAGADDDPAGEAGMGHGTGGVGGDVARAGGPSTDGGSTHLGEGGEAGASTEHSKCGTDEPFGAPTVLFSTNSTQRSGGRFWRDEKSLYFSSGGDLYMATRGSPQTTFPSGSPVADLSGPALELSPFVTVDGLSVYFNASDAGVLRVAHRAALGDPFKAPEDLAGLKPYPASPYFTRNEDVLYYDADDDALSKHHIWRTELTESGFSASAVQIAQTDAFRPRDAVVSRDEKTIYFAASAGAGFDVYRATRTSVAKPFSVPELVSELSTEQSDSPTWLSDDGCRIVVESDGTLYMSARAAP